MTWLYVSATGEESTTPADSRSLAELVLRGELSNDTLVRRAGAPMVYKPIQRVPELRKALEQARLEQEVVPPQAGNDLSDGRADVAAVKAAPDEDVWFYFDDGGIERGPLTARALRSLIAQRLVVGARSVRRGASAAGEVRDISLWPELQPSHAAGEGGGGDDGVGDGGDGGDGGGARGGEEEGEADWEVDDAEWVYRDDDGEEQGPFSTAEMRSWLEMGHLEMSLLVNIAGLTPTLTPTLTLILTLAGPAPRRSSSSTWASAR